MSPDITALAQVLTIVAGFTIVTIGAIVGGVLLVKRRARPSPRLEDNRLQHLEQAVDAIAVEVERISEAQRFTAKLFAERQGAELHNASPRARSLPGDPL